MRQTRQEQSQQQPSKLFNQPKCSSSGLPQLALDQPSLNNLSECEELEDPLTDESYESPLGLYRKMKAAYDIWTETEHKCHQELLKILSEMSEAEGKPLKDSLEASERAWMNLYGKESSFVRKFYERNSSDRAKAAQMYELMNLMRNRALILKRRIDILKGRL